MKRGRGLPGKPMAYDHNPAPTDVPPSLALWSLLHAIWGVIKDSWGRLSNT